ncbi:RTA1-domain-containing protein [Aaosphaeria arxii CBS 175.79]|uniref:RTA1-domain-containing protein n=1 Tax=Aaosphaeria arxii CBS 175.79 TaxID=1450172 RepID=A0A6A5XRP2_9PLEO|nr:RTA1-domain-containing protein [Aaosphaeria arxii CBS 175.79]KAF2015566.1 RTA1-domain-containing protein [Aaosphaeria arxii CBS 175.79]
MASVCNPNWQTATFSFYRYVPSVAAAVIFCLLFLSSTIVHLWQMYRTKAWFLGALCGGCFAEFIGYAARTASARQEPGCWRMMPYIIQSVFILLAPALFSASVYVLLGRIVKLTDGDSHVIIKRRVITKTFLAGDLFCLFMQCAAGGLMGGSRAVPKLAKIGNGIIIASLILQLVWFAFFVVVALMFHRSMKLMPTRAASRSEIRWLSYLWTLYIFSFFVMVRSLFRAIEFIEGSDGVLQTTEVYFYIMDSLLMFLAVTYLHWKHPGEIAALLRSEEPECTNGLKLLVKPAGMSWRQFRP